MPGQTDQGPPSGAPWGHFLHFGFYKLENAWWRLPAPEREAGKAALATVVRNHAERFFVQPYSLLGLRADVDFMLWKASPRVEDFQELASAIRKTALGAYLETPYAYLSVKRPTQYLGDHKHGGQEGARVEFTPELLPYLCVYPFTKTAEWYQLPFEKRQEMMKEHFAIGHKYPTIKIHTSYSFGLDDPEFMLSFEMDSLHDFVKLVMDLREVAARPYTLRDTPIFTCVRVSIDQLLESLG